MGLGLKQVFALSYGIGNVTNSLLVTVVRESHWEEDVDLNPAGNMYRGKPFPAVGDFSLTVSAWDPLHSQSLTLDSFQA
jgi:hypothetical protein